MAKRATAVAPISMAVMQTSPSPWAKCPSPAEYSPPATATGMNRREPFVSCLASTFPQFSRGGMVRSPSLAMTPPAGAASSGSGGAAIPPRRAYSASRAVHSFNCACDGASPAVPINDPSGMRTPGTCAEVAHPSAMFQCARYGSVNISRRKPAPGRFRVHP